MFECRKGSNAMGKNMIVFVQSLVESYYKVKSFLHITRHIEAAYKYKCL